MIIKKTSIDESNAEKILVWPKVRKNQSISEWRQVIFSDENRFSLLSDKPGYIWRKAREYKARMLGSYIKTIRKRNGVECMSHDSTGLLYFVQGTKNGVQYVGVLKDHLLRSARSMFLR